MNTPVSFELAKLLKEKGFDVLTKMYYINQLNAPTIAEVLMYLYEKEFLWIVVTPIPYSTNLTHWRWEYVSTNYKTRNVNWMSHDDYMSPTEAYTAAIEYIFKKLL